MIISRYFVLFIIFSFLGWIYECIYCTVKDRKWSNRGFLFGPICPIYGAAVVGALILFNSVPILKNGYTSPWWETFLICAVLSAVLEYSTSFVLEVLFHAVWWDYSDMPLNLNGRICLPATCGFGVAGIFIVRYLFPFLNRIPFDHFMLLTEFVSLLFMLILGIDIAVTVASLTDMLSRMEEMQEEFDRKMQQGYEVASATPAAVVNAAKNSVSAAKNSAANMSETITEYLKKLSFKDRHHVRSIRGYRSASFSRMGERIAESMKIGISRFTTSEKRFFARAKRSHEINEVSGDDEAK